MRRLWRVVWRASLAVIVLGLTVVGLVNLVRDRGWYEPPVTGGPPTMRLVGAEQYASAIHELFGDDINASVGIAAPQRRQGLVALGASAADITPGAFEVFDRAARRVAMQVVDEQHRRTLVPCAPRSLREADADCARLFFAHIGRFLYRRPLTEAELQRQVTSAGSVAEQSGDFYLGLAYSLSGMLISPKFIYFSEVSEPDPEHPGRVRLDAYSKATRLSLFLWDAAPDEALLDAAERGDLHSRSGLNSQITRMLASPRLEQGVRAFFSDFLNFDKFDTLSKDPVIYPDFTQGVAASAEEQALRIITDQLLTRDADYRDLFTTDQTFLDGSLGPLYRAAVPDPKTWIAYRVDPDHAAGLLTSLSFLALNSHPGVSSPTRRGRAVREILLCQKIPDPPPNVSFAVFEDKNRHFKTARERLQAHVVDPVCAGCHKLTDPIGLALENFDGAGTYHVSQGGIPINASGVLDGRSFTDVASFGRALHDQPALGPCLASRAYAYAIGREVSRADRAWLAYIARRFAIDGYRFPELLREIATSRAFFAVSNPEPPATSVVGSHSRAIDFSGS